MDQIAIYGAGDHGRTVAWTLEAVVEAHSDSEFVCFIDDDEDLQGRNVNDILVTDFKTVANGKKNIKVICAIGNPHTRQQLINRISSREIEFATIIYPNIPRSKWVDIGEGTFIGAGSILSSNIIIGTHVIINLDSTIGHDDIIEDYATISPGVHLGGYVHIGKRAILGLGVVVISGTKDTPIVIGEDALVGAGACVTKSIPPGTTVVGVPAKPISRSP